MWPFAIIVPNPRDDFSLSLKPGRKAFIPRKAFSLQRRPKSLCRGVIPTLTTLAHRATETVFIEHGLKCVAAVLATLVAMENAARRRFLGLDGHFQGLDHNVSAHAVGEAISNQATRLQVNNARQVQPALFGWNVGDIATPGLIDAELIKSTLDEIGETRQPMVAVSSFHELTVPTMKDSMGT